MYQIKGLELHNENYADQRVILALRIFACFLVCLTGIGKFLSRSF